ncbi:hypothetical protein MtrunA17_Chr6g0475461 [Medicago truncatula]|uniref:Uncharacterized protein n=1 Tax=Medicago truncatula TaxID=3880 RepID=A0A396HHI9_MEDTR|nr:hypothetical protein MtrunA17_Chr6g0475461 [Medicago truncatula]
MTGNSVRKCSGVMMMVSGMAATSLLGGIKDACRQVSTPTLKSVMELRKSVWKVL